MFSNLLTDWLTCCRSSRRTNERNMKSCNPHLPCMFSFKKHIIKSYFWSLLPQLQPQRALWPQYETTLERHIKKRNLNYVLCLCYHAVFSGFLQRYNLPHNNSICEVIFILIPCVSVEGKLLTC